MQTQKQEAPARPVLERLGYGASPPVGRSVSPHSGPRYGSGVRSVQPNGSFAMGRSVSQSSPRAALPRVWCSTGPNQGHLRHWAVIACQFLGSFPRPLRQRTMAWVGCSTCPTQGQLRHRSVALSVLTQRRSATPRPRVCSCLCPKV